MQRQRRLCLVCVWRDDQQAQWEGSRPATRWHAVHEGLRRPDMEGSCPAHPHLVSHKRRRRVGGVVIVVDADLAVHDWACVPNQQRVPAEGPAQQEPGRGGRGGSAREVHGRCGTSRQRYTRRQTAAVGLTHCRRPGSRNGPCTRCRCTGGHTASWRSRPHSRRQTLREEGGWRRGAEVKGEHASTCATAV